MKRWDEIPEEIIKAERVVSLWFRKRLINDWTLGHSQARNDTDRRKLEMWPELVKALDIAVSWMPKDTSNMSGARNYMLTAALTETEKVIAKAAEIEKEGN